MPKFLISMIGLNRLEGTRQAVEAVLRTLHDAHLVLTDNGSSDGTGNYFDEVAKRFPGAVTVVHNAENMGFQPPNENAFLIAIAKGCTYFIALNDDAIVPKGWLERLAQPLDRSPQAAISGPAGGCQSLNADMHGCPGGALEYIEGSCMCVKIAAVLAHRPTLFWPKLKFIYSEDSELSLFLREKGYTIHKVAFDLPHARSQTTRSEAVRQKCDEAQRHNHELNRARWAHYLRVRKFSYPTVVRRSYAIGDVLLTTPIIRAIKKATPLSPIFVQTNYPEVFARNPDVEQAARNIPARSDALVVDLNMSYERMRNTHIVQAYERCAREHITGLGEIDPRTSLFVDAASERWANDMRKRFGSRLCVIHPGPTTWPGKNWHPARFGELATWLVLRGWHVAIVGQGQKPADIRDAIDLTRRTSLHQLAALLARAQLFVGVDSLPIHVAQAMNCPVVGVFGVTDPRFILVPGSNAIGVTPNPAPASFGKRHQVLGVTHLNEGEDAINAIRLEQVQEAIQKLVP